jgi:cell wall-associated NlpC family hydrolase
VIVALGRRFFAALALPLLLAAPAPARAQDGVRAQPPYTLEPPFAALSRSALALRDSLVARARAQVGKRYRHGGETPTRGFDCSGLVAYVLSSLGLAVPRTANAQSAVGSDVVRDTSQLRPGDLLTFGRGKKITHIGIYVGDGRFVHASSRAGRVVESRLLRAPAPGIKPWQGVRRLVAADSAAAPRDSTG